VQASRRLPGPTATEASSNMSRSDIAFMFGLFFLRFHVEAADCKDEKLQTDCVHTDAEHPMPETFSLLQHHIHVHSQAQRRHHSLPITYLNETPPEEASVLIHYVNGFFGPCSKEAFTCEIPCRRTPYPGPDKDKADVLVSFPMERYPRHNSRNAVSIGHSMESLSLFGGKEASKYDATATMDLKSTVPWTYFNWQSFSNLQGERKQPEQFPGFRDRQPRAVFIARNCLGKTRNLLLSELASVGVPIDSISSCKPLGTSEVDWPADVSRSDKHRALKKYRVYMALENVVEPGYVTEKIMDGYMAGNVNVYLGAPDVTDYVPSDSFIDANGAVAADGTIKHEGFQTLALKIKAALDDELTWTNYFNAFNKPMNEWNEGNYEKKWSWSKERVDEHCRLCRLAFARRAKGGHFNTTTQQVEGVVPPPVGHSFWRTTWKSRDATVEVPHCTK